MILEKKIFSRISNYTPKVSGKDIVCLFVCLFVFTSCKSMGNNDLQGGPFFFTPGA